MISSEIYPRVLSCQIILYRCSCSTPKSFTGHGLMLPHYIYIYIYNCNIYFQPYIWHPYIYEFHIYMNYIYMHFIYIMTFIYMAPLGPYDIYIYIYIYWVTEWPWPVALYWPFVKGIHRWHMDSPHRRPVMGLGGYEKALHRVLRKRIHICLFCCTYTTHMADISFRFILFPITYSRENCVYFSAFFRLF